MTISESAQKFLTWAKTADVGCMFARAIAVDPHKYLIRINTIVSDDLESVKADILSSTEESVAARDEGIFHILEAAFDVEQHLALMRAVSGEQGWRLTQTSVHHDGHSSVLYSLKVDVGRLDGLPAMSEVLAFAPYSFLPRTRRAPVCAWAIRTKPELSIPDKENPLEKRANLAAIKFNVPSQTFDKMWTRSEELRAQMVGTDNPLARARVTMSVPTLMA